MSVTLRALCVGLEFIGAQGDEWDSPEDMAMAVIGSLIAVAMIAGARNLWNRDVQPGIERTA